MYVLINLLSNDWNQKHQSLTALDSAPQMIINALHMLGVFTSSGSPAPQKASIHTIG